MALRKTPATRIRKTKPAAAIKSVQTNGTTVNIASGATAEKVVVLFASRISQKFILPNGHAVLLAGNAVHLAGKREGVLPQGGYSVNFVDKADWLEVKKLYGKAYAPWFETGKIVERSGAMSESSAVTLAADNAGDDCDLNPVDPKRVTTKPDKDV